MFNHPYRGFRVISQSSCFQRQPEPYPRDGWLVVLSTRARSPTMAEWQYFDFENKWATYHKAWFSDEIQTRLEKVVTEWVQSGWEMEDPNAVWEKGVDLWKFSATDLHHNLISDRAEKRLRGISWGISEESWNTFDRPAN